MTNIIDLYYSQFENLLLNSIPQISNIKPSEWAEQNVVMSGAINGKLDYRNSPYTKEIIDCFAPDHPMRKVAVMKGAQLGFSSTILIPLIGWIISQRPANTYLTVGAPELIGKAMEKIDLMITSAGLRDLIKPQTLRNRNQKSGDTNEQKEFIGGYVKVATADNHKAHRQLDLEIGLFDDWEAAKKASKESGDTRKLVEVRFNAFGQTSKIAFISTPEVRATSNIEPVFMLGDQRKYLIPCPCCHELIELKWSIAVDSTMAGIYYKQDSLGNVVPGSVGYVCQRCSGFFKDNNKLKLLQDGRWQPTAIPSEVGFYSYHLSALYAPPGMLNWEGYVRNYLEANPHNQPRKESLHQTFVNTCLGETYEMLGEAPKATEIQKNIQPYNIGVIPEKLSITQGNGKIVLITCGADMNGTVDDARLDYEITAFAENGVSYSILHGSVGTYIPNEHGKVKVDREKWTYEMYKERSVWTEFERIISDTYPTDNGKFMQVIITGVDVGYKDKYAYNWIDNQNAGLVVALRGEKENQYMSVEKDVKYFKLGKSRADYYLLAVGFIKDDIANFMNLKWNKEHDKSQPNQFMNYPIPANGLYLYENFFSHYESEHRTLITKKDGNSEFRWVKKQANSQNHLWDCRVYNLGLKEIFVYLYGKALKQSNYSWNDYVTNLNK